jgi:methanogenic corrinoid protein MtbC1
MGARDGDGQGQAATELRGQLVARLRENDKPGAVRAAVAAVADVLTPLLVDTGSAWQSGQVAVWQEHLASAAVRTIVESLYHDVLRIRAAAKPVGMTVLLACPPGETHDLGLRMVSDRFDMAGWTAFFLGADTPAAQIVDAARSLGVDAVVISSSTHFHRVALRTFMDQLRGELPGVRLWVGGPAFAHDRDWPAEELPDLELLLGAPSEQDGPSGPHGT